MTITVLSPHRDDAAFSIGLTIASWLARDHRVEVVNCFTRSEYSPFGDMAAIRADETQAHVTNLRREEDLRWARQYARPVELTDLNLLDAPQRLHCAVDEVCRTAVDPRDPAMTTIRAELRARAFDALVLPLAIGDHVDHLTARMSAQDGWPASLPIAFYEDLPYAARPGGAGQIAARTESIVSGLRPMFAKDATEDVVDSTVETKRQLALCYPSQIDPAVADQIASFSRRYGGRERLWANRAWCNAGLGGSK